MDKAFFSMYKFVIILMRDSMEVKIEKLDHFGRGITYLEDKICFVENALPGEIVDVSVVKRKPKYLEAKVDSYIEKSSFRIADECPYSNICGGCSLGHMTYEQENEWKEKKIREIIQKYTSVDVCKIEPIIFHERNHYRNKIVLHGDENGLGLYQEKSNQIVSIDQCLLVDQKINECIPFFHNCDIQEAIIKTSNDSENRMISISGKVDNLDSIIGQNQVVIVNGKCYTKEDKLLTKIGTKKFYEGVHSFFQVNRTLTEKLYEEVVSHIQKKKYQTVLDLYCGTGTIGIFISGYVGKVIGIDSNDSNISDALKNKEINHVQNIEFICDKVENCISSFQGIDCIIVDPPRAGLDSKTKEYLHQISASKIIYVSCDPVTLARDIQDLSDVYSVEELKPFNMFPRTYHVECVCLLMRK